MRKIYGKKFIAQDVISKRDQPNNIPLNVSLPANPFFSKEKIDNNKIDFNILKEKQL